MLKLETARLLLRPVGFFDRESIFAYRSDASANRYQGWIPSCIEDVDIFIRKLADVPDVTDTWFQLGIVEKASTQLIGDIGLHFLPDEQMEIGYTLNLAFQKMGYATEALKRVVDYLFIDLGKHRIIASIDPDNTDSIRLVKRLGFRKEGHFIESVLQNGKWVDDVVYALLAREWCKRDAIE